MFQIVLLPPVAEWSGILIGQFEGAPSQGHPGLVCL